MWEPGKPTKGKCFKLLGILYIKNIPCAWDLILYGSLGFAVPDLEHFFVMIIQERTSREGIKNKILYESTHLDPDRKQTNGNSSS
ncbi:unnamed protein product [Nyctereutes procyonoides]|uniref:(raccoon dog) hypothetical protein n=1 Tax=Nyctereutes procyonoides TaxID=34880 RepID=A0A811Y0D2_NYCPR|nr:unnamed protein product [Nyctereutes procyonoides]